MRNLFLSTLIFVFYAGVANAAEECVNGALPQNDQLIQAYRKNNDPLKKSFIDETKPAATPICNHAQKQTLNFMKVAQACDLMARANGPFPSSVKLDCLVASTNRRPGGEQFICDESSPTNPRKSVSRGNAADGPPNTNQCFTRELADYVRYAINQAIKCLSNEEPIDAQLILKKINNETSFNFSLSGNGGRGLMQLTTPAVREMTNVKYGQALYVMQEVAKSSKKSCAPFRQIASADLANPKGIQQGNICDWTNTGDGLARNLLYGIGYHRHVREKYIKPHLQKIAPQLAGNREIVGLLSTISFGPEGIKGALGLLSKNRVGKKTQAAGLKKSLLSQSSYLNQREEKQEELLCLKRNLKDGTNLKCDDMKFSDAEIAGNTCVSK
ncbi:MAG: hypothetical protein H7326_04600 [Bdellovibrionaceae bacterium]|nr:hypothetical protein [Pseudobdellovibrionaceae bacterium]